MATTRVPNPERDIAVIGQGHRVGQDPQVSQESAHVSRRPGQINYGRTIIAYTGWRWTNRSADSTKLPKLI